MTFEQFQLDEPAIAEALVQRYVRGTINREREAGKVEAWLEENWRFTRDNNKWFADFRHGGVAGNWWSDEHARWFIGEDGEAAE